MIMILYFYIQINNHLSFRIEKLFRLCHSADSCFSIKIEIYPFIWHDGVGNMKDATSFSYRLWANPFSSSDVGYRANSVLFSFYNTIAFSNFEVIGILPLSLRRNSIFYNLIELYVSQNNKRYIRENVKQ